MLGIILVQILFGFPICLISTELATLMPTNHGIIAWVYRGFCDLSPKYGKMIGLFTGLNYIIYGFVGISVQPAFISQYIQVLTGKLGFGNHFFFYVC